MAAAPPLVALVVAQAYERFVKYAAWPSPRWTLPLLGNAVEAAPAFMRFLLREAKKVDGLFLFWPGGARPICVVATPAAARAVLADQRRFPKGADYRDKFGLVFGDGLVTSAGASHATARRVLGRYFTRAALEAKAGAIAAAFDDTAAEILDPAVAAAVGAVGAGGRGADVDVQEFFHLATLRAFCRAMLSEDIFDWTCPGREGRGDVARYVAAEVSFGSNVVGEHMLYNVPMSRLFPRVRRITGGQVTSDKLGSAQGSSAM